MKNTTNMKQKFGNMSPIIRCTRTFSTSKILARNPLRDNGSIKRESGQAQQNEDITTGMILDQPCYRSLLSLWTDSAAVLHRSFAKPYSLKLRTFWSCMCDYSNFCRMNKTWATISSLCWVLFIKGLPNSKQFTIWPADQPLSSEPSRTRSQCRPRRSRRYPSSSEELRSNKMWGPLKSWLFLCTHGESAQLDPSKWMDRITRMPTYRHEIIRSRQNLLDHPLRNRSSHFRSSATLTQSKNQIPLTERCHSSFFLSNSEWLMGNGRCIFSTTS